MDFYRSFDDSEDSDAELQDIEDILLIAAVHQGMSRGGR